MGEVEVRGGKKWHVRRVGERWVGGVVDGWGQVGVTGQ